MSTSGGTGTRSIGGMMGYCGDGNVDPGEQCDDGNMDPTDLCLPDCTDSGLMLWHEFDGDGTNMGQTPGYDAVMDAAITYVAGKYGQGAQCAGEGPGVTIPNLRDLLVQHPNLTMSVWVYEDSYMPDSNVLDLRIGGGGGWKTYHGAGGRDHFTTCVSGTNSFAACGASFVSPTAVWVPLSWRYAGMGTQSGEGAPLEIYLDGVLVDMVTIDNNKPLVNESMKLDGTLCSVIPGNGANDIVDDFEVWGRTFGPAAHCRIVVGGVRDDMNMTCTAP